VDNSCPTLEKVEKTFPSVIHPTLALKKPKDGKKRTAGDEVATRFPWPLIPLYDTTLAAPTRRADLSAVAPAKAKASGEGGSQTQAGNPFPRGLSTTELSEVAVSAAPTARQMRKN
jgi:hypothetical protein